MTQSQLESAVVAVTGESVRTVHQLGFGITARRCDDLEPEDLRLVVDCPFCRHPVPSPVWAGDGSLTLAECVDCDVYFDTSADEIYAAARRQPTDPRGLVSMAGAGTRLNRGYT